MQTITDDSGLIGPPVAASMDRPVSLRLLQAHEPQAHSWRAPASWR